MLQLNLMAEISPLVTSFGLTVFAITRALRQLVIDRQEGKCADCERDIGNRLEIHHKVPRVFGGSNHPDNLIGLCGKGLVDCHSIWDDEALNHLRLPDGTPLKISNASKEK